MMPPSKCEIRKCVWFMGFYQPDGTEVSEVHYCAAFPDGIPDDISYGDNLHTKVQKGQVGQFVYEEG